MKALVIGSSGFVGRHLSYELQVVEKWDVVSYNYRDGGDVRNYESLRNTLDIHRPDVIFHLAAQAYVPESFANPLRTFEVNTIGSVNLLEAVRHLGLKTTVVLVGTSEEYGDAIPLEDRMLKPHSPYAVSKVAMDYMGQLYAEAYGMHVVVTRAFNHTGPGRGEMYAESAFAKQIAEIEFGRRQILEHGNLGSTRNYTDVRDIVKAYAVAVNLPPGTYNICSTENLKMEEVLELLKANSTTDIPTRLNPSLGRPSDFSFKTPHCSKFQRLTGWKPEIPLNKTMVDLLDYWRERM